MILYGNLLRMSSLQRFLPAYFEFTDDKLNKEDDMSPKTLKRQKMEERHSQIQSLLCDCEHELTEEYQMPSSI